MVQSGDQGASPPGRAPKDDRSFGVSFVEHGLRVMPSLFLLTFRESLFVSIIGCLPHTSFLVILHSQHGGDKRETRHIKIFI